MKSESKIIAFDSVRHTKKIDKRTLLVGAISRGGYDLDCVYSGVVTVDGDDATDVMIKIINETKYKKQLRCIILKGLSVAGFNLIDLPKLYKSTGIPVISVMKKNPDQNHIKVTLTKLGFNSRIELLSISVNS